MMFILNNDALSSLSPVGVKKAPVKLSIAKRRTKYKSRGCEPTVNDILLCSGVDF